MLNLENNQTDLILDGSMGEKLEEALDVVCEGEGIEYEPEVSLYLVSDEQIRETNRTYRGKDAVTDVLSFPTLAYHPGEVFSQTYSEENLLDHMFIDDRLLLGDVMISGARAAAQSAEFGHSLQREVVFLFVHSLLHLLGYDHMEEADRARMVAREQHYMNKIGVDRT